MIRREFFVPGKPTPKARARTLKTGHSYTPKPTQLAEAKVLECYLAKYRTAPPLDEPLAVHAEVMFVVPPSWSKKRKAEAFYHVSRPDADNLGKLVTDALNGVAFTDDALICDLRVTKHYRQTEGIRVVISDMAPTP
jgi:Holliday junction resolvase RusA-like endonuclease